MSRTLFEWLNTVMPKDGGARRVARDVPFGDHPAQMLDIYAPKDFETALPVLVFFHGGGWNSGTRAEYEFAGRAYAAAGFITVLPGYRIVPEAHFPDFVVDGALALNWIDAEISVFGGDPKRLALMGHSAGAYNAAMLALDPARFGANAAPANIKALVGLSGPFDFYPFEVPEAIETFSRTGEPERTQPINLAHPGAPPAYLGHGTKDTVCGLHNTENLAAALRASGVPVIERHYAGIGHAAPLLALFPLLRWRVPVYRETVRFLHQHLG